MNINEIKQRLSNPKAQRREETEQQRIVSTLQFRIDGLKNNLRATDYQAIKYAEGELTAEEYAETLAQRRAWRAEINALEAEIKAIKEGANEN